MTTAHYASIIIDNYNYARFLGEAIESALAQTYPHTEIIVVDDGSTDESREVIAGYGARVIAVLKENGGQASAFNAGFKASRGDVIIFLDADDMLLPMAVEKAMPLFGDPDVVKVHWPRWIVDKTGKPTGKIFPSVALPEGDLRDKVLQAGPTSMMCSLLAAAWSRSFIDRISPVPEDIYRRGADTYLFELAPFFGLLRTISEPQDLYRQHGANGHLSMTFDEKLRRELRFYENCCSALQQHFSRIDVVLPVEEWRRHSWWYRQQRAVEEIAKLPHAAQPIIVADAGMWELGSIAGRQRIPFPERAGVYDGIPPSEAAALNELARLRNTGASFLVVGWPAFWWLDSFAGFGQYLRSNFMCVRSTEDVLIFDLRSDTPEHRE